MTARVLFVDDEPNILQGLQRMLRMFRSRCELEFASGGAEALDRVGGAAYEAVITDLRMPRIDGAELLWEVRERSPGSIRVILTGQTDRKMLLRSVEPAHQVLTKPCDPAVLRGTLERVLRGSERLPDGELRLSIARLTSVPGHPDIVGTMKAELRQPVPSLGVLSGIFSRGITIAAKLYQISMGALGGMAERALAPDEAARMLGLEFLQDLASLPGLFLELPRSTIEEFELSNLWEHSLRVSRALADHGPPGLITGLLHDIGRIVLVAVDPARARRALEVARAERLPLCDAERRVLGFTHGDVGAYLLAIWGFPDPVVEAVASHHTSPVSPLACALARADAADPGRA